MIAKEKARELRDKMFLKIPSVYDPTGLPHYPIAKEMALIAVKEVFLSIRWSSDFNNEQKNYWREVEKELEKL